MKPTAVNGGKPLPGCARVTVAGVAADRRKRPGQGAAPAAGPSVSTPSGENGANVDALPDFFEFSVAVRAA